MKVRRILRDLPVISLNTLHNAICNIPKTNSEFYYPYLTDKYDINHFSLGWLFPK